MKNNHFWHKNIKPYTLTKTCVTEIFQVVIKVKKNILICISESTIIRDLSPKSLKWFQDPEHRMNFTNITMFMISKNNNHLYCYCSFTTSNGNFSHISFFGRVGYRKLDINIGKWLRNLEFYVQNGSSGCSLVFVELGITSRLFFSEVK